MRILSIIAAGFAASAATGAACAHPGAKILTTGSNAPRAAMTEGMSFAIENGVHVYRGASGPAEDIVLLGENMDETAVQRVIIERRYRPRSIRALRAQGFYSGRAPETRPFTQGFYSGR